MKTKPERQYDIFLVEGEDPIPPAGSHLLTTYDSKLGGHWAIQAWPIVQGLTAYANLSSASIPSWNEVT